jgi:endonuclease/exonuclease/phosphatase family metal-dependent hydrolase
MTAFRVGTWNVEYGAGTYKNELRLARLRDESADVWVLTETHDDLDLSPTHVPISTAPRPNRPPGSRWTSIWSCWPIIERLDVGDPVRTVAALLRGPDGPLVIYGTVLPWQTDAGPNAEAPAKGWTEHHRVLPMQLTEWRELRERFPDALFIVAGDFNMNFGEKQDYGTARGRTILRDGLAASGLSCLTEAERIPEGLLNRPPVDHVVVSAKWTPGSRIVAAWEGTTDAGLKLSDHSGLVIEVSA